MSIFALIYLILSNPVFAEKSENAAFAWAENLKSGGVRQVYVCGSSRILPNRKSMARHFFFGKKKSGYVLSDMPNMKEYFALLQSENFEAAKISVERRLEKTQLWAVQRNGRAKSLGYPSKIEIGFTATVKDCMEGAKTTLGGDCSGRPSGARLACCQEKFVGPRVLWGEKQEYQILYSPDPSVRLKVAGEKNHRFCDVQNAIDL